MAEQPQSIADSFAMFQSAFRPEKVSGVNRTIQFDFTGREAGSWNLTVRDGTLQYGQGPATNPNATLTVDSDEWLQIVRGEANPVTSFMSGKIKVSPPTAAMDLMQFQNWFAR